MYSVLLLTLFDETILRIINLKDSVWAVPLSILIAEEKDPWCWCKVKEKVCSAVCFLSGCALVLHTFFCVTYVKKKKKKSFVFSSVYISGIKNLP